MNTVKAEILAGIKFGGFRYTSSHKNLAVLNLAVTALLHLTRTQNNVYIMSYLCALSRFTAARIVTMSTDQFEVSSVIRGHHVYKHNWSPFNGEELTCLREEENDKDHYAVAVTKSGSGVVGHVPRRISAACALFLQKYAHTFLQKYAHTYTES